MKIVTKIIVTIGIVMALIVITAALQLVAVVDGDGRPPVFIVMLIMYGVYAAIKAVWKKKKTDNQVLNTDDQDDQNDQDDQDTPILQ